jgi:hypothetical protein
VAAAKSSQGNVRRRLDSGVFGGLQGSTGIELVIPDELAKGMEFQTSDLMVVKAALQEWAKSKKMFHLTVGSKSAITSTCASLVKVYVVFPNIRVF